MCANQRASGLQKWRCKSSISGQSGNTIFSALLCSHIRYYLTMKPKSCRISFRPDSAPACKIELDVKTGAPGEISGPPESFYPNRHHWRVPRLKGTTNRELFFWGEPRSKTLTVLCFIIAIFSLYMAGNKSGYECKLYWRVFFSWLYCWCEGIRLASGWRNIKYIDDRVIHRWRGMCHNISPRSQPDNGQPL